MKRITAEDIMIPLDSYPHVPYWFSLRQAIAAMDKSQIHTDGLQSLPRVVLVFDEQYQLMGMVRRRDILRGLGENALSDPDEKGERNVSPMSTSSKVGLSEEEVFEKIRERAERPVSEVITPIRVSVDSTMLLSELVDFLVIHDTAMVPVVRDGSLVGVVRSTDVLRHVGKLLL
ncbi:CBS domain-containing protein [bacterium]|nr:CBS domain-containing protein [bacterium]